MADNSDYTKPHIDLFKYLPEPYQSEASKALIGNLFNRFLTKQETTKVAGYIGDGNPAAVIKRQIQEFDVHRQAYQLQPILYNKVGSIEWMSTWKDILTEAERLGINLDIIADWLSIQTFNWVPPINIDKLIHYRDYYWYDEQKTNSRAQYITIRSRCATAGANVAFYEALIQEFGEEISVAGILPIDDPLPAVGIVAISLIDNTITVSGDVSSLIFDNQYFEVQGATSGNNGIYTVDGTLTYDVGTNRTTIPVDAGQLTSGDVGGVVLFRRYDKFIIAGDYKRLFDPDFVFFFRNSSNTELDRTFNVVKDSTYDENIHQTVIQLTTYFTDRRFDGVISLVEDYETTLIDRDCRCTGTLGWDMLQWDDNPLAPLWDGDHEILLQNISHNGPPTTPGSEENELWWDVDADRLYKYNASSSWTVLWNSFSLILDRTTGQALWDETPECGETSNIPTADQWFNENKWVHKSDVKNFSLAKQAQLPIIEFEWDVEINEWTSTVHKWKYRADTFEDWESVADQPAIIELTPITLFQRNPSNPDEFMLDERYGDLTDFFTPGAEFMATSVPEIMIVEYSKYLQPNADGQFVTVVKPTIDIQYLIDNEGLVLGDLYTPTPSPTPLRPTHTTQGDPWRGYNFHWVYDGMEATTPVNHQPINPIAGVDPDQTPTVDVGMGYEYRLGLYAQEFMLTVDPVGADVTLELSDQVPLFGSTASTRPLNRRALFDTANVRVYVNGVRTYGTYVEVPSVEGYVESINISGLSIYDVIVVEVGESSILDFGTSVVPVRTLTDDAAFALAGTELVCLTRYRRQEQIKGDVQQEPLYDMYNVDGATAYAATPIFSFATSQDADVNPYVGKRLVVDAEADNYVFTQHLVDEDNGRMYAYRDYANHTKDIWLNPETDQIMFWDGLTWAPKTYVWYHYIGAIVSKTEPTAPWTSLHGLYWYDTIADEVKQFDLFSYEWISIENQVIRSTNDPTIQTIWKKGLNDEKYVPQKRDWEKRTLEEYNAQKDLYVEELSEELFDTGEYPTRASAITEATTRWYDGQKNHLSANGEWIGDWEIPDPLFFNHSHENHKNVNYRELLTHFNTIIQAQPKVPGFNGPREFMYRLIPANDVNYGLGGKIKEYNYGFDTFLSSMFINTVSPRGLYEFAQDQYEVLLRDVQETLRAHLVDLLIDTSIESLTDQQSFVVNSAINLFESDDNLALIYGDTTTFTDNVGAPDTGVRNWIATLPHLALVANRYPLLLDDNALNVNQIFHHDGHRNEYAFADAIVEAINRTVVNTDDPRTYDPIEGAPTEKMGTISVNSPPDTVAEFLTHYDAITNKNGIYWYQVSGTTRILYRLTVAGIGIIEPASSLEDGSLWLDLTPHAEVLRHKVTNPYTDEIRWEPIPGIGDNSGIRLHNGTDPSDVTTATIAAWQVVDVNTLLLQTIFEIENRLYDNVPNYDALKYDFSALQAAYPTLYSQYLEEQFLAYTSEHEIIAPYANTQYSASNAFTWNYKHSSPGIKYPIIEADPDTNSFVIEGAHADNGLFDPCQASSPPAACTTEPGYTPTAGFFIKNTGTNDGTWYPRVTSLTTPSAETFVVGTTTYTRIYVSEDVQPSEGGMIYLGQLPCTCNTGAESGGEWRDVYEQMYGTPYPNLEPWILQGYDNKPDWWDAQYLNDDTLKWGDRRWKYAHGFNIVDVEASDVPNTFSIDGDFREVFITGLEFDIDRTNQHGYVTTGHFWTIDKLTDVVSVITDLPAALVVPGALSGLSTLQTVGACRPAQYGGTSEGSVLDVALSAIELNGDWTDLFSVNTGIVIQDNAGNIKGLYTVVDAVYGGPPSYTTFLFLREPITDATDFDIVGGTTYNFDTNVATIRVEEDIVSSSVEGRIYWGRPPVNIWYLPDSGSGGALRYGMWGNIQRGIIPPGEEYPNGVVSVSGNPFTSPDVYFEGVSLPRYNYFSVNIDNVTIVSGGTYAPDGLFPPFWNWQDYYGPSMPGFDSLIRSIFYLYFVEIVSPGADYVFGDAGPVEWEWRVSSQFLYDQLTVAFRLDPIKFIFSSYGVDVVDVAGLMVDAEQGRVLSHTNTSFHGDVQEEESSIYTFNGTNQWYVNYLRRTGYDLNTSDFRTMWTNWSAPMMYQFSSFVDTPSLDIAHRYICVSEFDYRVAAKRSPGVEDYWVDSFDVYVLNAPPKIARYNNEANWEFEIRVKPPLGRTIEYYDVQNYQFTVDPTTDTCTLYKWPIKGASSYSDTFQLVGDRTELFVVGSTFDVTEASGNNGTYTVDACVYDSVNNETIILVEENVTVYNSGGYIRLHYRTLPWETGEQVILTTEETLPIPLEDENVNGLVLYYFIAVDDYTFKLARTRNDAHNGVAIDLTTVGRGSHYVGKLLATFSTPNSGNWRHYALDTSNVLQFIPPFDTRGIQHVINIIDGYQQIKYDEGWRFNVDGTLHDFVNTSLQVSWQHEIERWIEFIFAVRAQNNKRQEQFQATVDETTNVWTFVGAGNPQFITGDAVSLYSTNGVYPTPLRNGGRYYMIRDTLGTFRLAATKGDAFGGIVLDISDTLPVRDLYVMSSTALRQTKPAFELNPMRNAIWFRPERGIVSNLITGPSQDVFNSQLLVDQYGRKLNTKQMRVFREDKQTAIKVAEGIPNDVHLTSIYQDPYDFIHLGSAHLFVDTYEHVLIFNNYTVTDALLYDPFVGLNVNKFELLFNRQQDFTQRPNVGGQYLETYYNQSADLKRNWEASVEDMRLLYDTYTTIEANTLTEHSRKVLGYEGRTAYFDELNLSAKSQFAFWRGQIQHKGAMTAVKALISSRRFLDAKVDEFWAVKVGEFGSANDKECLSMWLKPADARSNELRLQFAGDEDLCRPGYAVNDYDEGCGYAYPNFNDEVLKTTPGFETVIITDDTRWMNQPDQAAKLLDDGGMVFFDMKPVGKINVWPRHWWLHNVEIDVETWTPTPEDNWVIHSSETIEFKNDLPGYELPYTWDPYKHWGPYPVHLISDDGRYIEIDGWLKGVLGNTIETQMETEMSAGQLVRIFGSANNDGSYRTITSAGFNNALSGFDETNPEVKTTTTFKLDRKLPDSTDLTGYIELWGGWVPNGKYTTPFESYVTRLPAQPGESIEVEIDFESATPPIYRHNLNCDKTQIIIQPYPDEVMMGINVLDITVTDPSAEEVLDLTNYSGATPVKRGFIPACGMIRVFKEDHFAGSPAPVIIPGSRFIGVELKSGVDYLEQVIPNVPITTELRMNHNTFGNRYLIVYGKGTLVDGVHYDDLNRNIVQLRYWEYMLRPYQYYNNSNPETVQSITIWGLQVDKDSVGPEKIDDVLSKTSITPVQVWDPDRGHHYYQGIHIVDIKSDTDPAIYTNTLVAHDDPPLVERGVSYHTPWTISRIGTTWLDTHVLAYLPYHDVHLYPTYEDRFRNWGKLADWADIKIYTWVESDVDPDQYDILATQEEGNISIPDAQRRSGRAKRTLFEQDNDSNWYARTLKLDEFDVIVDEITRTSRQYQLQNIVPHIVPIAEKRIGVGTNGADVVVIDGDWSRRLVVGTIMQSSDDGGTHEVLSVTFSGGQTEIEVEDIVIASGNLIFYEPVDIAVDGYIVEEGMLVNYDGIVDMPEDAEWISRFQVMQRVPTDETFITAEIEAGNIIREVEYSTDTVYDENLGTTRTKYYFWVENKSTRSKNGMSPLEAQNTMQQLPIPYVFFQNPKQPYSVTYKGVFVNLPWRMNQAIIRGLRGVVDDEQRYVIHWQLNHALRHTMDDGVTALQKKNVHEQWQLIRAEQQEHIARWLWNRITESIVHYKLTDVTKRVPSYEREFYDANYNTKTRYGLGDDQAFVDGNTALTTILAYLTDPTKEFAPVDINVFFDTHTFSTPEDVENSMATIYNTFSWTHVNAMFFSVLHDALSLKDKYEGIMKTSMIALHGIRPFQVGGLFDD